MYVLFHVKDETVESLARYLLWLFVPGCAIKQVVNVFQLSSACTAVAHHDALLRGSKTL